MSHYYIKPERDKDFYVVMSTFVDNWVFAGTTAEVAKYEAKEAAKEARKLAKAMMTKADEIGTSSARGRGRWDDEELSVRTDDGLYFLRRADLRQYVDLTDMDAPGGSRIEGQKLLKEYEEE